MIYELIAFSHRPLEDIIDGISLHRLPLLSVVSTDLESRLTLPSISAGSTVKTLPVACERADFYSLVPKSDSNLME